VEQGNFHIHNGFLIRHVVLGSYFCAGAKGVKSALDSYWGFLIEIGTCPDH